MIVQPDSNNPFIECPKTHATKIGRDVCSDDLCKASALRRIGMFWKIDLDKVNIFGWAEGGIVEGLHVAMRDADGEVIEDVLFKDSHCASISVQAKEGRIIDCMGRTLLRDLNESWIEINGYPANFPTSVECSVDGKVFHLDLCLCD